MLHNSLYHLVFVRDLNKTCIVHLFQDDVFSLICNSVEVFLEFFETF